MREIGAQINDKQNAKNRVPLLSKLVEWNSFQKCATFQNDQKLSFYECYGKSVRNKITYHLTFYTLPYILKMTDSIKK